MTVDDFLRKYSKCPFCRNYRLQGDSCDRCKWKWANGQYAKENDIDRFDPSEEWSNRMNKEVTEV